MSMSIDECVSDLLPFASEDDKKRLTQSLDDLSRNAMIRKEIMIKRDDGKTVEQACRELAKSVNKSWYHIRDIYYGKRVQS
ncbi:hypothetical protein [Fodinibius sp. SL11]|uniref:hypothetical protein n=1 Tax=Fodinibius sp. SL11 TaxID=3425690 RepID=UPI003F8855B1